MATIRWRGKDEDHAHLCWCESGVEKSEPLGRISKAEAEKLRKVKEVELETGERVFYASVSFIEHRTEYLGWHASEYPHSHFRVDQILTQRCGKFESKALGQITRRDVDLWKADLKKRVGRNREGKKGAPSGGTLLKEFSAVRALFTKAVEWKRIKESPFDGVAEPANLNKAPPHWYRKDELARLYAQKRCGDVWKFMANTGVRLSEVLHITPEHVDLKLRQLSVQSREDARTKSGEWRMIPLNDYALEAAKRLLGANADTGYLIPHIAGPSLSRSFKNDRKRLKLKGSTHSLRHSYGTHLALANVPPTTLQKLMGHARIETTLIYVHIAADLLHMQARAVNI